VSRGSCSDELLARIDAGEAVEAREDDYRHLGVVAAAEHSWVHGHPQRVLVPAQHITAALETLSDYAEQRGCETDSTDHGDYVDAWAFDPDGDDPTDMSMRVHLVRVPVA
jgi:hypothetical protein